MKTKSSWELKVLAIIAVVFVIGLTKAILFPIILSFLLYLLLSPIQEWLVNNLKLPRGLAAGIITCVLLTAICTGITLLAKPAYQWIESGPENFRIIESKFKSIKISLGELNKVAESAQELSKIDAKKKVIVTTPNTNLSYSLFDLTSNVIFTIAAIILWLFFLLIYFKSSLQKFEKIIFERKRISKEHPFVLNLKSEVSRYMLIFSSICIGLGSVMALVFWTLNVPNAALWGVMVAFLNFIPYLGHLVGIIIMLFISLITFDSYFDIAAPPLIYLLFAVLEGQVITPIFLGKHLKINPIIIFLTIFIWSWLWGVSGAFISIPLLITFKLFISYQPNFSKYASMLE